MYPGFGDLNQGLRNRSSSSIIDDWTTGSHVSLLKQSTPMLSKIWRRRRLGPLSLADRQPPSDDDDDDDPPFLGATLHGRSREQSSSSGGCWMPIPLLHIFHVRPQQRDCWRAPSDSDASAGTISRGATLYVGPNKLLVSQRGRKLGENSAEFLLPDPFIFHSFKTWCQQ